MQHKTCGSHQESHCHPKEGRPDYLLWGSLSVIFFAMLISLLQNADLFTGECALNENCVEGVKTALEQNAVLSGANTIFELMTKMAWGLVFAILFVGVLEFIPRAKFHQILGKSGGFKGVWRATLAGVILDLCSHGILLVAMKLYERGASLGQVMAFLVASPWNSLSMTLILWSLIGLKLTVVFIVLSCVIAVVTGLTFEKLEAAQVLPANPNQLQGDIPKNQPWFVLPKEHGPVGLIVQTLKNSLHESRMILRWIFFGVVLTAVVKELMSPESFQAYFGPDTVGVLLTVVSATILEVCSEGSAPLASELVVTAKAPGNAFTFLMAGVSTDYTEILALKETTKSWKIAFFLPLVTLPQIIIIGILMNQVSF